MELWNVERYLEMFEGDRCPTDFRYCSGTNDQWLTVEELRDLIKQHVDRKFSISDDGGKASKDVRTPSRISEEITREK
jgi:hypothetical protein